MFLKTTIGPGTAVTYVPVVYTQTFAPVLDQYPTPAAGVIGYGDLRRKEERDADAAAAAPTGLVGRMIRT
jgi:hypothetical protein